MRQVTSQKRKTKLQPAHTIRPRKRRLQAKYWWPPKISLRRGASVHLVTDPTLSQATFRTILEAEVAVVNEFRSGRSLSVPRMMLHLRYRQATRQTIWKSSYKMKLQLRSILLSQVLPTLTLAECSIPPISRKRALLSVLRMSPPRSQCSLKNLTKLKHMLSLTTSSSRLWLSVLT